MQGHLHIPMKTESWLVTSGSLEVKILNYDDLHNFGLRKKKEKKKDEPG